VVVPLLRSTFHITNSEAFKNRTLYYRKVHWNRVSAAAAESLAATLHLTPLTNQEALTLLKHPSRILATGAVVAQTRLGLVVLSNGMCIAVRVHMTVLQVTRSSLLL
jgi:hypothetical protein